MLRIRLQRILKDEAGFTLIELLAVAVILIILSLMALPVYAEVTDKGRAAKSAEELRIIEQALEQHKADTGHYPNRLDKLVQAGYLKPNFDFKSPWYSNGNQIYYFYAVDRTGNDAATRYIVGDYGLHGDCGQSAAGFPCGKADTTAWVITERMREELVAQKLNFRASH